MSRMSPQPASRSFSSTVTVSLITGVPIIADRKFLEVYGEFLSSDAVYFREDGQTELDVMLGILRKSEDRLL